MTITIPANDFGKIRVFALTGTPAEPLQNKQPDVIAKLFGYEGLNLDYVDVVDIAATGEMGLLGLLQQGYGLTPDEADIAALSHLSGWVILVMSRATSGSEATLNPMPVLSHVTTLGEDASLTAHASLESEAAKGVLEPPAKPAKSDARIGGMVAMVALIVMFALVGLMIWVAG